MSLLLCEGRRDEEEVLLHYGVFDLPEAFLNGRESRMSLEVDLLPHLFCVEALSQKLIKR